MNKTLEKWVYIRPYSILTFGAVGWIAGLLSLVWTPLVYAVLVIFLAVLFYGALFN